MPDMSEDIPVEIKKDSKPVATRVKTTTHSSNEPELINCLRNEKIIIEFIPNERGLVSDPKHVLYGGLGESSKRRFVVPLLNTGVFKNVLTNSEKAYLEYVMGLQDNALSVYREKESNYWTNLSVTLGKEPSFLDLSVPEEYIKYKILLANSDYISPSKEDLRNNRKATYQFVMSVDGANAIEAVNELNITAQAYKAFSAIQDDLKKLAVVVESTTGRTVSKFDKVAIWAMVDVAIKDDPAKFLKSTQDEYIDTKVLIKDGVSTGHIMKRQNFYYLTETRAPLCNEDQDPTLYSACQFLNSPKNQEILFLLQSKINS